MADLMSGPNAPLTRAFIFCGWRCITIDWLINPQHDLANLEFQRELHEMLKQADCICAALDCSTKSRAREIPRRFEDGRPAPKPLRSDERPTGLPHLRGSDLRRVTKDNQACDFVLQEIQELADRGGASLRENPARSLHCGASPGEADVGVRRLAGHLLCGMLLHGGTVQAAAAQAQHSGDLPVAATPMSSSARLR